MAPVVIAVFGCIATFLLLILVFGRELGRIERLDREKRRQAFALIQTAYKKQISRLEITNQRLEKRLDELHNALAEARGRLAPFTPSDEETKTEPSRPVSPWKTMSPMYFVGRSETNAIPE